MRYDDDYDDLPRRLRLKGVSPAWRVLGILASIAAGLFLLLAAAFGVALITRPKETVKVPNVIPPAPVVQNQAAPMNPFVNANDDGDEEPANPPYPTVADLQQRGGRDLPGEPKAGPKQTARDRFLQLGQEIWSAPAGHYPQHTSVSPDGKYIAYVNRQVLMVGPVGGLLEPVIPGGWNIQPGAFPFAGQQPNVQIRPKLTVNAIGNLTWSDFGRYLYFADADGNLNRYEVQTRTLDKLPLQGDSPLPMPMEPMKLVLRRSRATLKLDVPGSAAAPDPAEIALGDMETRQVRVLIPESQDYWGPMAVSPDGKRLILISDHGLKKQPRRFRLFLLDLTEGKAAEPRPIGPACKSIPAVCWELDSIAFLCARSQEPIPADGWEVDNLGGWAGIDLFRYDVDAGRETRLSRGGGFDVPLLSAGGEFLFLAWQTDLAPAGWRLYRAHVAEVMKFAAQELSSPSRDRTAWTQLLESALKETGLQPDAGGDQLASEVLAKLADTFAKRFREHFKAEPPSDAAAWERLHRELATLELPPAIRVQAMLILGACEGEYLRRRHGAVWRLTAGPVFKPHKRAVKTEEESPFALAVNPFEAARIQSSSGDSDDEEKGDAPRAELQNVLRLSAGRRLVLTNDPVAGRKAVQEQADPDLARGLELFQKNKADEGERLLLDMMQRKQHEKNGFLALRVGQSLFTHERCQALRQLMEPRVRQQPPDPVKYNLLGLALLEADPKAAIVHFKTALRCNLYYGTAYLNLAQAYQKTNEPESALLCLKRYLKLMPYGPMAHDARQRLAAIKNDVWDAGP